MTESKTSPDWLRFRTQSEPRDGLEAFRGLYGEHGQYLNLEHIGRGKDGWQQAALLRWIDMPLGRVDFGGQSQRGWVRWNITGKGCEWVKDWDAIEDLERLPNAEIKRADIALTTWRREVTHELVEQAHKGGKFLCGGRPPALQSIVSTDPRAGRTCTVGKRDTDKFFRGYEKGWELVGKMGALGDACTEIEGFPVDDIYRCEVEFKDVTRVIPWDIVHNRDQYFAGAYPFLAELLPDAEGDVFMRRPERAPQTDLAAALANAKAQYGRTFYTALVAFEGDIGRLLDSIMGTEHNAALVAAGVLQVQH